MTLTLIKLDYKRTNWIKYNQIIDETGSNEIG